MLSSEVKIRRTVAEKDIVINTKEILNKLYLLDSSVQKLKGTLYEIIIAYWKDRILYFTLNLDKGDEFAYFLVLPDKKFNSAYTYLNLSGRNLETEVFKSIDLDIHFFDVRNDSKIVDFSCELNKDLEKNRNGIRSIIATHHANKILFINIYFVGQNKNTIQSCLVFPETLMDSVILNSFV